MELRQLRYFDAVADELSFTRAAETLGISQPGLSQQIRQLEAEIGAPLFDRIGRRIRLTPVGTAFARHARAALRAVDRARSETAEIVDMDGGVLRIGAIQSFDANLIPPATTAFRALAPRVQLQINELPAPRIEELLVEGDLDVGVAFAPPENDAIASTALFEEELVGAVAEHEKDLWPQSMTMDELAAQPLALLAPSMFTRRMLDRSFASVGVSPRAALEANSIECLLRIVAGGGLCAVVPERAILGRSAVSAITLTDPTPMRTAALLRLRGAYRPKSAATFEKLIVDHARATMRQGRTQ